MKEDRLFIDLDNLSIHIEAIETLTKDQCEKYFVFPYCMEDNELYLAVVDYLDKEALKEIKFITKKNIKCYFSSKAQVLDYINNYYKNDFTDKVLLQMKSDKISNLSDSSAFKEEENILSGPTVSLVDSIIFTAVNKGASDIHIEPFKEFIIVRLRIDGMLQRFNKLPRDVYDTICTRIKIMCKMNIAWKLVPQDGKFSQQIDGAELDFRVSSLPTINGEKIVIRILHKKNEILTFKDLGFNKEISEVFKTLLKSRQGLILITGPTGSGKTTTLYSMLREVNKVDRNIVTIEDPVEYELEQINQVNVNNQSGITFAKALRTVLRQDPDIIMVGEIIDEETAEIAVRASLTGHLVLTTLHTNDASASINRLVDMKVPAYLVSDSLVAIIAQRLARKVCDFCKESYKPNSFERRVLGVSEGQLLYRGRGCVKCHNTGYRGRTVVYEIIIVDNKHRTLISSCKSTEELRRFCINSGMKPLSESFKILVLSGETTIDEYISNLQGLKTNDIAEVIHAI